MKNNKNHQFKIVQLCVLSKNILNSELSKSWNKLWNRSKLVYWICFKANIELQIVQKYLTSVFKRKISLLWQLLSCNLYFPPHASCAVSSSCFGWNFNNVFRVSNIRHVGLFFLVFTREYFEKAVVFNRYDDIMSDFMLMNKFFTPLQRTKYFAETSV